MKTFARLVLLLLWLFAIVAPSVITIMDVDNPVIVTNLNEEEQQETSKKSPVEEKVLHGHTCDFSIIAQSKKSVRGNHHPISHVDHTQEILLPPPEHIG
ncbi:MAG: hypothetical protein WBM83_03450 [Flavobacteriaceae bacterium]